MNGGKKRSLARTRGIERYEARLEIKERLLAGEAPYRRATDGAYVLAGMVHGVPEHFLRTLADGTLSDLEIADPRTAPGEIVRSRRGTLGEVRWGFAHALSAAACEAKGLTPGPGNC